MADFTRASLLATIWLIATLPSTFTFAQTPKNTGPTSRPAAVDELIIEHLDGEEPDVIHDPPLAHPAKEAISLHLPKKIIEKLRARAGWDKVNFESLHIQVKPSDEGCCLVKHGPSGFSLELDSPFSHDKTGYHIDVEPTTNQGKGDDRHWKGVIRFDSYPAHETCRIDCDVRLHIEEWDPQEKTIAQRVKAQVQWSPPRIEKLAEKKSD